MTAIGGFVGVEDRSVSMGRVRNLLLHPSSGVAEEVVLECVGPATLGARGALRYLENASSAQVRSAEAGVALVCDGTIYNQREVRAELESRGYRLRTGTQAELLLYGYRLWGLDELLNRLNGAFAIAIWDLDRQTLSLVRDRLGIKPLVYAATERWIAFACTPRALRAAGIVREIDEAAVAEFLEFGFVTDARVIYRNAAKAPAATIVEWRAGKLTSRCYWRPEQPLPARRTSFAEAVETTREHLLRAVQRRVEGASAVGALLSGGIDSALVCWALKELNADVTALTLALPGEAEDESTEAVRIARSLGIPQSRVDFSMLQGPGVEALTSAYAEPFACASALGMLALAQVQAQAAAPRSQILLTGDGGDDLFLGYRQHRYLWIGQSIARRTPAPLAQAWERVRGRIPRTIGPIRRAANFADYLVGGLGAFVQVRDGLPFYHERELLGERMRDASVDQRSIPPSLASARRMLSEYLDYDRTTQFTGEYLTKIDGATRRHGIEARSPFLDHELWSYASALPFAVRLHRGELKAILREIVRREFGQQVGRDVAAGRKRGFQVPAQRWLVGRWRPMVRESFADSLLEQGGWIRGSTLVREFERVPPGGIAPVQLWYLYVLESWLRAEASFKQGGASVPLSADGWPGSSDPYPASDPHAS